MSSLIVGGHRPYVQGKFLFVDDKKLYVRGVTYGTFGLDEQGNEQHDRCVVERDFAQMAANGLNAVRTYTVPPRWLLDCAQKHGLYVMVGLPWEQHIAFLDDKKRTRSIEDRVRAGVRACAGHPAVLCYAIGNEIPASILRWYGQRRVVRFLKRLYVAAKAEDADGLVTYVNYPSTEYLQLPFVDLVCFNVYLESQDKLTAYLARLQNISGDRPLLLAEMGLDSRSNGEETQAHVLDWQIRAAFAGGCAGAFVFAWTDEWFRGGSYIENWDFGLTDRQRAPKAALAAVRAAFTEIPFAPELPYPRMSVVVCTYNGQRTIGDCCEGLLQLDYPNYEVIIIDDGSTDASAHIASEYGFRVISTPNAGLSAARNLGMEAASGEIIAYIDDDARPDPHWLTYLATTFMRTDFAGVGGPNVAPPGDGFIAACIANAPGGPVHVLISDQVAEHIPGCNMAFRKARLQAIGGFDPQFRIAGDDVDICWRLQQRGWQLGFNPAALVWHHRRNSLLTYWRQQKNYGKAEALLEKKWPEKYNAVGHLSWAGRLYGKGLTLTLGQFKQRIYQGAWGSALFQSIYQPAPGTFWSLSLMPEWLLVIFALAVLSLLGFAWTPLFLAVPLLILALGALVVQAGLSAAQASYAIKPLSAVNLLKLRVLTALLHIMQPIARLEGRLRHGLTPWRQHSHSNGRSGAKNAGAGEQGASFSWPYLQTYIFWNERWSDPFQRLEGIEKALQSGGAYVRRGGDYDDWDLEIRGGLLGSVRILMAVEEHGGGRQQLLFRCWPRYSAPSFVLLGLLAMLAGAAALDHAVLASAMLAAGALFFSAYAFLESASAMGVLKHTLRQSGRSAEEQVKVENKATYEYENVRG